MLYNEMCMDLEDLCNSVNQYFPNHQSITLYACVKDLFKLQNRKIDFKVIEQEKFIIVVSDSTLQITFKEVQLAKFWCMSHNYVGSLLTYFSLFQLHIGVSQIFFRGLIKIQNLNSLNAESVPCRGPPQQLARLPGPSLSLAPPRGPFAPVFCKDPPYLF